MLDLRNPSYTWVSVGYNSHFFFTHMCVISNISLHLQLLLSSRGDLALQPWVVVQENFKLWRRQRETTPKSFPLCQLTCNKEKEYMENYEGTLLKYIFLLSADGYFMVISKQVRAVNHIIVSLFFPLFSILTDMLRFFVPCHPIRIFLFNSG